MKLFEITQKKAESDFLFGDCASFAIALQQKLGGEIYSLDRDGKSLHVFVKVNGKNIDVVGPRGTYSMAMSIVGSPEGFKVSGPYSPTDLPVRKPTPSKIRAATEYIDSNIEKYNA